ncbi:MAG TPA: hypothetical protein ENI61_01765 [Ignavibacteria bacterium]|nr:hypothetical protein [Ignavibacteria bacterium]
MYVLGLNIGHNATACILSSGKVIGCISEERLSRIKNHSGIPFSAIKSLLSEEKISLSDIDMIVVDDAYLVNKSTTFVEDFQKSYLKKTFLRKILSKINNKCPSVYKYYFCFVNPIKKVARRRKIIEALSSELGVSKKKINVIDHHEAHALSASFNLDQEKRTLVLTLDGEGSGTCASVNIFENSNLKTISRTWKGASLGYFYSLVTLVLGMKPLQDEFKVMGLASYSNLNSYFGVYQTLSRLVKVESSLEFSSPCDLSFADEIIFKATKFQKFDNIAGAAQKVLEERVCEWINLAMSQTNIKDIALSGGVFMNIKLVKAIGQMKSVNSIFVVPSSGDESNAIGSAFYGHKMLCKDKMLSAEIKPLRDLYLGPSYDSEIKNFIKENKLDVKYVVKKPNNLHHEVAMLLANGEIVARFSGRSEWGARSLGNRSILANPAISTHPALINKLIKSRDFWMPFSPSILDSFEKAYLKDTGKIISRQYMVATFDVTELGKEDLLATLHAYDLTTRPHIVTAVSNPDYHDTIKQFCRITGIGAVLNTSFNIHGEPNVLTPKDAISVFERTHLKHLVLGEYLIKK